VNSSPVRSAEVGSPRSELSTARVINGRRARGNHSPASLNPRGHLHWRTRVGGGTRRSWFGRAPGNRPTGLGARPPTPLEGPVCPLGFLPSALTGPIPSVSKDVRVALSVGCWNSWLSVGPLLRGQRLQALRKSSIAPRCPWIDSEESSRSRTRVEQPSVLAREKARL